MNFSSDSLTLNSKSQNEDFVFHKETPRGHFFAVLDFVPHDYANLKPTLEGKLETVLGSFSSLSRFSADLFLEFLAREINNFLHHLGEQTGGPEMLCSAALTLINGNRLSYLICGDVSIDILSQGELLALSGTARADASGSAAFGYAVRMEDEIEQLGGIRLEATVTDRVQAFALKDDDLVLIMTRGIAESVHASPETVNGLSSTDPELICEELLQATASTRDDRTIVVIGGPYEPEIDPVLSDLNRAIAALEARVNTLMESSARGSEAPGSSESELSSEIERIKQSLSEKAATADLLQLEERLRNFDRVGAGKAENERPLTLQDDVSQLRDATGEIDADATQEGARPSPLSIFPGQRFAGPSVADRGNFEVGGENEANAPAGNQRSRKMNFGLIGLLIISSAVAAAFGGAWLQSRVFAKSAESWLVKTTPTQLFISRIDGNGESAARTVSLNVAGPLRSSGEQTFSSFADVKRYIDAVTISVTPPVTQASSPEITDEAVAPAERVDRPRVLPRAQPVAKTLGDVVAPISAESGDSLKAIALRYNVAPEKIRQLNPAITRWSGMARGQRINIPLSAQRASLPVRKPASSRPKTGRAAATMEITVAPGDSLNRFVLRYKSTPERLKALNPQITNWSSIQAGQKVRVPTPPGG